MMRNLLLSAAALSLSVSMASAEVNFDSGSNSGLKEQIITEIPLPVPAPQPMSLPPKSIYGDDDRLDYYQVDAAMKERADSVVSFWESAKVTEAGDKAKLKVVTFGDAATLCPGEKFAKQPYGAGSFCSGALVGEDIVMTAGHCITDEAKCADTKLVFGYALKKSGDYPRSVPLGDVYSCKSIIKRSHDDSHGLVSRMFSVAPVPDFALIKLDRKVTDRKPLPIHRKAKPVKGDKVFVIGYPVGLPLKVAGKAKVRDASLWNSFTADLDTFAGNSGSPVFNADTNLIEGILVSGDKDFNISPDNCRVASIVPQNGGSGEIITKISALEKFIP